MDDFSRQMEMVLYNSVDGDVFVNAYIKDETLWVSNKRWQNYLVFKSPQLVGI